MKEAGCLLREREKSERSFVVIQKKEDAVIDVLSLESLIEYGKTRGRIWKYAMAGLYILKSQKTREARRYEKKWRKGDKET